MFDARHNLVISFHIITLITPDIGRSYERTKIRVFACTLSGTSPTGITTYVNHRTVGPAYAISTRFNCRNACCTLYQSSIPATGHCKRNGKNSFITMDYVGTDYQRYAETAFLYSYTLKFRNLFHTFYVKYSTDFSFTDRL